MIIFNDLFVKLETYCKERDLELSDNISRNVEIHELRFKKGNKFINFEINGYKIQHDTIENIMEEIDYHVQEHILDYK